MNQGWQSDATDGLKGAWGLLSFSLFLSFSLCFSIFLWLSTYLPTDLSVYLSICLSIYLPNYLSIYLSIYIYISLCLSVCLSTCLSVSFWINVKDETILRDFFIFFVWQHPKRSNPARLLQFLNLTTSNYQWVLRFCYSTYLKYCACHEKLMPSHTKCYTCHAKSP